MLFFFVICTVPKLMTLVFSKFSGEVLQRAWQFHQVWVLFLDSLPFFFFGSDGFSSSNLNIRSFSVLSFLFFCFFYNSLDEVFESVMLKSESDFLFSWFILWSVACKARGSDLRVHFKVYYTGYYPCWSLVVWYCEMRVSKYVLIVARNLCIKN